MRRAATIRLYIESNKFCRMGRSPAHAVRDIILTAWANESLGDRLPILRSTLGILELFFQLFCVFYGVGADVVVEIGVDGAGLFGLVF